MYKQRQCNFIKRIEKEKDKSTTQNILDAKKQKKKKNSKLNRRNINK